VSHDAFAHHRSEDAVEMVQREAGGLRELLWGDDFIETLRGTWAATSSARKRRQKSPISASPDADEMRTDRPTMRSSSSFTSSNCMASLLVDIRSSATALLDPACFRARPCISEE
jgi:hypothetical protein